MISIIIWTIFVLAYLVIWFFKIGSEETSSTIIFISGLLVLLIKLFDSLQKQLLKLYFFKLRIWHWLKNTKAKWWIGVRFDGNYSQDIVSQFREFLLSDDLRSRSIKIKHFSGQRINFLVKDSLNFYADLTLGEHYNLSHDSLTIELSAIEIGYNDSVEKLNTEIIPLLESFSRFFKPNNQSFDFHIEFQKSNPFFALYINHLKPESIEDFNVYLHIDEYSGTQKADTVQINKEKICITTQSTNALKELARDFLLLSPKMKGLSRQ